MRQFVGDRTETTVSAGETCSRIGRRSLLRLKRSIVSRRRSANLIVQGLEDTPELAVPCPHGAGIMAWGAPPSLHQQCRPIIDWLESMVVIDAAVGENCSLTAALRGKVLKSISAIGRGFADPQA